MSSKLSAHAGVADRSSHALTRPAGNVRGSGGSPTDEIEGVDVIIRPTLTAAAADVLAADGYLLGTPVRSSLVPLLRSARPNGDARVVDHQSGIVIAKVAGEGESRGGVLVPLPRVLVGDSQVDLFEPLGGQVERPNVRGRSVRGFADPQVHAVDR